MLAEPARKLQSAAKGLRKAAREFRRDTGRPASTILSDGAPLVHVDEQLLADCKVTSRREGLLHLVPRGGKACEVGTSTGKFARAIAAALQPEEMHLVDIDYSRFDDTAYSSVASVPAQKHVGSSFEELAKFNQYFDFIYIDADHSYGIVKKDIDAALQAIKPTGFLMFNDYCRWSIEQAEPYGVLAAVNEFANKNRWVFRGVALSGSGHFDVLLSKD